RLTLPAAVFLIARTAAATAAAAAAVSVVGSGTVRRAEGIDSEFLLDLLATIIVWLVVYHVPAIVADLRHETWRTVRQGVGVEILASASLLFLAPIVVAEPRGWTFALLLLPLIALNRLTGLVNRQAASLRRDEVTGLLNQRGLADIAADLGRQRRRRPGRYALLLIRLNSLRDLDDAFGRQVVDRVLTHVARRLAAAFGNRATVGRPDTDDLVVLVPRGADHDDPEPIDSAVATINRLVKEPVAIDGLRFDARATIGTARAPEDASDFPTLARYADAAIRYGRPGETQVAFTRRPQEEIDRRLNLLADLSAALRGDTDGGHVEFAYQPQVRLDSGEVIGVEALLRWTHPTRGAVSPGDLFAVVEPTPLVHDITRLAVETAIHQVRRWDERSVRLRVSVNVTVRDLQQGWLIDHILDRVHRVGVAPDQLVIEVTENEVISEPELVRRSVDRLVGAGVQVAVDDFGSGFASLQHLRQLPLNQLKIDKGLVRSIADNPGDRAVVRSVIDLARALGLTVVAEGVENQAVHQALRRLGCPMGQGYFYGPPTTAAEIVRALSARSYRADRRHSRRRGAGPASAA
ncbi:MAG: bifunctional diguanylate cyclase/phosphodiesterase, partial [Micromonosporaceae bacterium]|nr:bifunctional diguanylate cyclase/phosphodiesterase [Micromonosporaceae bacterium]